MGSDKITRDHTKYKACRAHVATTTRPRQMYSMSCTCLHWSLILTHVRQINVQHELWQYWHNMYGERTYRYTLLHQRKTTRPRPRDHVEYKACRLHLATTARPLQMHSMSCTHCIDHWYWRTYVKYTNTRYDNIDTHEYGILLTYDINKQAWSWRTKAITNL